MDTFAKAIVVLGLLPVVGSGIVLADHSPLLAQSIVPTDQTTQTLISDQGVIDINGGTQAAGNLFHSFDQFNLDQGQTANFITLPSTEAVIGQVIGGRASTIDGLLQVTGSQADLYLINPAGLLFGPNAQLDLRGSFTATTATHLGNDTQWFEVLSNPDYSTLVTSPSHFGFSRPSSIVNHGQLTVLDSQHIRLLAPQVTNTGTLIAPDGEVTLFAAEPGQTIHLGQSDGLLSLEITASDGASDSLAAMITGGNLDHSSSLVIDHDGAIALVSGNIPAASPPSFTLYNTGNISTQGSTGGEINLLGNTIQVTNSLLDASGSNQGGHIRIGGDYQGQRALPQASQVEITHTASLMADATQGNGGQVIVWSDGTTLFDGTISAQSATGDGGLVETSGLKRLRIGENASVVTTAPHGETGIWLLDPTDLTIVDTGGLGAIVTDSNDITASTINALTIVSALNSTNVILQATDTIDVNAAINTSDNDISSNLFLDTATLNLNERITLQGSGQLSGTANTVNVGVNGSIQNGVDAVTDGGTVNLAATIYREGDTITLDHPLTLIGQGQDSTFISGDTDNNGVGDHKVFDITSSGYNINLIGLTIKDGSSTLDGAGLSNAGDNVAISNVTFANNEVIGSARDGGAIHNRGSLTISNSTFENNSANRGGGLFNSGIATLSTVDFSSNLAISEGGGLYNQTNATSMISTGIFTSNSAQSGGGIYNGGNMHLLDNVIANNQATGVDQNGGAGILNTDGGSLIVDNSLIANNTSATHGGGILNLASNAQTVVEIANSSIVGNQAATKGGGIENASLVGLERLAELTVINSTISINQAMTGGGIRTVGPTTLTNVTIAENIATSSGGGISENEVTAEIPALTNTIVANNRAPINPDVEGQFSDQGHNLIGIDQGSTGFNLSTLVGTTRAPLDPIITSLNNNLSPLPSHQLLNGSPAANAGHNSVATTRDQHGQPRIIGDTIDIGAVESDILPNTRLIPTAVEPEPQTPIATPQPHTLGPFPSTPQQQSPAAALADTSFVSLNNNSIFRQEEQSEQAFNPGQNPITPTSPNGRLRYFDEEAFQYLEDSFSQEYERYWQLSQTQPVTLPSVQDILHQANQTYQTNTAVIYATFVPQTPTNENSIDKFVLPRTTQAPNPDDQLLLLLVTATGEPVQQLIDVSRAELTQQAKLFRLAASDPEDSVSYQALARQMYDWLLDPLEQDLAEKQIDHVMYSLDQGLRNIPLATMMKGDRFVIEKYSVSLIPSMGLTQLQIGNIDSTPSPLIAGVEEFSTLNDLPAVPIELDVVAKRLQSNDVLLNETFTLDNFLRQQTSQNPNLLHLATHAEFNAGNLEESFIQFWDSSFTFEQMKDMPWAEIELLILSACNTALSSPDAELGFIGLAAAAGIETSMGSLWNVSDVGTLALMAEFYAQLPNTSLRSDAIQQAQLSLLRGETHINNNTLSTSRGDVDLPAEWNLPTADFAHPFYWAGFTMVGNPWR
ncbi:CHAT domain-containing protein [Leptothoe sp. PORK10 BA2]|uniref:CHAT domain-containing protein n=1 Tax=Leptothoe sp. PORK10 BA2 TaxID=3110254 RepID=UPI002B1F927A|nr:CHAT domain-containing protein [Leptothoe sp. PORK10 BA2]MEA5465504.1 CHAT domain-containing protein [Leptothoe sp. PORK10 BA2]